MNFMQGKDKERRKRSWYQKYLPFVARSPEMQIEWLVAALKKKRLTREELAPYIHLFLEDDQNSDFDRLKTLFQGLDKQVLDDLLVTVDIYDTPKLFRLLPEPTLPQALIALNKHLPVYEKKPKKVIDEVFFAVNECSGELLQWAAGLLLAKGEVASHFQKNYERFLELLYDENFLISIYPNTKR